MENQRYKGRRFQIHWNKLGWVDPRNLSEGNNPFCVSFDKFYLKDNNETSHWVGHSKSKPLDLEYF